MLFHVLGLRCCHRLPLHVVWVIRTVETQRDDVVNDEAWAWSAMLAGRWALVERTEGPHCLGRTRKRSRRHGQGNAQQQDPDRLQWVTSLALFTFSVSSAVAF